MGSTAARSTAATSGELYTELKQTAVDVNTAATFGAERIYDMSSARASDMAVSINPDDLEGVESKADLSKLVRQKARESAAGPAAARARAPEDIGDVLAKESAARFGGAGASRKRKAEGDDKKAKKKAKKSIF